jgi:hypothetical protein
MNTILSAHDRWSEWYLHSHIGEACHIRCSLCLSPFLVKLNNMLFSRAQEENMTLVPCQHCSGGSPEASEHRKGPPKRVSGRLRAITVISFFFKNILIHDVA